MYYNMQINEGGKLRYADGNGYCPGDVLHKMIKHAHIRKGATVKMGSACWYGGEYVAATTVYQHVPERDTARYAAWQLVGTDHIEYTANKPY